MRSFSPLFVFLMIVIVFTGCETVNESDPSGSSEPILETKEKSAPKPGAPQPEAEQLVAVEETEREQLDPAWIARFQTEADAYLQSVGFSGAVLVAKDGIILLEKGFGMADRVSKRANTADTRFRIASLTKQFTAVAVLLLEQEGLLSVDDRLGDYLPEYEGWRDVTIHELLSHTSGIPREAESFVRTPVDQILSANASRKLKEDHSFIYSNINYVLLGRIVEKVSGTSLESFLEENVFSPLTMADSGIVDDSEAEAVHALGEQSRADDYETAVRYEGAGALYTTVRDLYRWNDALSGDTLLSESSRTKMFASHSGRGYGYGWFLAHDAAYHLGNINGFGGIIAKSLKNRSVVVVLSNHELRRAQTVPISDKLSALMEEKDLAITR